LTNWADLQLRRRGVTDAHVLAAMERVPRELFVPVGMRRHAYDDAALELSHGQTISQPYIVALICASLRLAGAERVLDVGTGSGYQAAVLSELAGSVISVERIPALAEQARRNLQAAGYAARVEVVVGDGTLGLPERAPFDAIAVAAAAAEIPPALEAQLAPAGRLVLPVGESLVCVERTVEGQRRVQRLAPRREELRRAAPRDPRRRRRLRC
jgi:protein-L-isoaspartate(D-aspartate) O-methyltransferase